MFLVGFISTFCTILGVSLGDIPCLSLSFRILLAVLAFVISFAVSYFAIGRIYRDKIELMVNNTPVEISCGDIFRTEGYKVIGCDTHFHTIVDDVIISKKSLHGRLVLEHGRLDEIKEAVRRGAERLNLKPDENGLYTFPLGSIVRYESSVDG